MKQPAPILTAILVLGAAAGGALLPRPTPALGALQAVSGSDLFHSNCDGCHPLPDPEQPKRSRAEWEKIVKEMVEVRGATLTRAESAAVLRYLDSFNRVPRQIDWVEGPARSHRVLFSAAPAGSPGAGWVDLVVGSEETLPWSIEAEPGGKGSALAPPAAAEEGHFPLLIDNTGVVRDGSVAARLQIAAASGSSGAGIVFGFRSPQSYYGVRVSPRDVVLYRVEGGERALLARAAAAVPLKTWVTLGVKLSGRAAAVELDGKPLAPLARPLPGYAGGRVGLQAQGGLTARFDQWQVTVP